MPSAITPPKEEQKAERIEDVNAGKAQNFRKQNLDSNIHNNFARYQFWKLSDLKVMQLPNNDERQPMKSMKVLNPVSILLSNYQSKALPE